MTKSAWGIAGAGVLLAGVFVVGALWDHPGTSARPGHEPGPFVAADRSSDLRDPGKRLPAQEQTPKRAAVKEAVPASASASRTSPADLLLAKARAAAQAHDAQGYTDALKALFEAGEPAYPALIQILLEMEGQQAWLSAPENSKAFRKLHGFLRDGAERFGGLMDAILVREGEPDVATLFAFRLSKWGATSALPAERQEALLLSLLARTAGQGAAALPGHGGMELLGEASRLLLGTLKSREALPMIEKLTLEHKDGRMLGSIAVMGGPEALASLRRILDKTEDAQLRLNIVQTCQINPNPETAALLREAAARPSAKDVDPSVDVRFNAQMALAASPENRDQTVQQLRNPQLSERDRTALLSGLLASAGPNGDQAHTRRIWSLYESEPGLGDLRDDILRRMSWREDPKAREVLVQRIREGQVTEMLADPVSKLDPKTARENATSLQGLMTHPSTPLQARLGAFASLSRVDRPGALASILAGFPRLPDKDRAEVVRFLWNPAMGEETRSALERIATSDPSESVRETAERALRKGP